MQQMNPIPKINGLYTTRCWAAELLQDQLTAKVN